MIESSVQQIQQRLTCPVCLDRYKVPKLLPCQHTFCLNPCLTNLIDTSTRKIKCPECRMLHSLPSTGRVESFPNNITILRFLDVDFKPNSSNTITDNTKCNQCNSPTSDEVNLNKCLDCEKMFCSNCYTNIHMVQLKNEAKQAITNLRRQLPKLSESIGNYEQKKIHSSQNAESIKRDITLVIERLIGDLKNRERCLHAEAEVYMQSQLRTISLEKENAEIELASVSSFCDSAEIIFNTNSNQNSTSNEIAMTKKQCKIYADQMNSLNKHDINSIDTNKVNLVISDLNDLSEYIKNFGLLTISSNNQQHQELSHNSISNSTANNQFLTANSRRTYNLSYNSSQETRQQQQQRQNRSTNQRQTWTLNDMENILPYYHSNIEENNFIIPEAITDSVRNRRNNQNQSSSQDRPIFGGGGGIGIGSSINTNRNNNNNNISPNRRISNVPRSIGFNINLNENNIHTNSDHQPTSNLENRREGHMQPTSLRSNTFILEQGQTFNGDNHIDGQLNDSRQRSENNSISQESALYNVRRARRARTPMTFNIMLDEPMEPLTNLFNENNTNDHLNSSPNLLSSSSNNTASPEIVTTTDNNSQQLLNPKINYASKKRAKMILGKQGRDNGEFIWPIDVAINQFNQQIIVSDSGNHRIQIFMEDGRYFKYFGKQGHGQGMFDCAGGLYIDSMSNIFVVDRMNHRVQIFDRYCRFIRSIGSQGSAPGQLNFPWGIAVSRLSEIFVCDKENDRISVFHFNGKFIRSFGTSGTGRGQFDKPYYIHITRENKVLVSDCSNHRIQIFDMSGVYINGFGSEGTGPGQFKHPRGITTDSEGFILVADSGNNRIQVFRGNDYAYITSFGGMGTDSGKFRGIEGITCNNNGDVVIADKENHRIQIM